MVTDWMARISTNKPPILATAGVFTCAERIRARPPSDEGLLATCPWTRDAICASLGYSRGRSPCLRMSVDRLHPSMGFLTVVAVCALSSFLLILETSCSI